MHTNHDSEAIAGPYGRNLGTKYGADEAPSIVTRSLRSTEIAVTEICVHRPPGRLSDPIPRVNALMGLGLPSETRQCVVHSLT
jgi:hypothetical protein